MFHYYTIKVFDYRKCFRPGNVKIQDGTIKFIDLNFSACKHPIFLIFCLYAYVNGLRIQIE